MMLCEGRYVKGVAWETECEGFQMKNIACKMSSEGCFGQ